MPFDVCPGAQHQLARRLDEIERQQPHARLREHSMTRATFNALVFGIGDPRPSSVRLRATFALGEALGLMADVERERADANTEASFEADVALIETSESADRCAPSPDGIPASVTDPVGALGELTRCRCGDPAIPRQRLCVSCADGANGSC